MKARKIIELSKEGKSILVSLWPDDKVISCATDEVAKRCDSDICDENTFDEYIDYLKGKGYQATEFELSELGPEESLPKFLEEREEQVVTSEDVGKVEEIIGEPEAPVPGEE